MAVNVHTTPSCTYCTMVKNYLREKRIPYHDFDISRDTRKADEMIRNSGQIGVPVIEVRGRVIVGFNKAKINAALR